MVKLVTRTEWGARPPKAVTKGNLGEPSTGHWNGPTITIGGKTTWEHSKCAPIVRGIQNFHMDSRNWSDIAYNYLECPHGYTFEGRGLNTWNGANGTNAGNRSSHAICSLAGQNNSFPETEKVGFKEAVAWIASKTNAPNAAQGHRDHKSTECPGNERYNWIRSGMPTASVPSSPQELFVFETRDDRVKFIWKCYQVIANRNPTDDEVNFWDYVIATNSRHALDLILDLMRDN